MTVFPQPVYKFVSINGAYTAQSGDCIVATVAAAYSVTLPPVGQGGVVSIRKVDTAAFAATLVTSDGSTIDGVAGATGVATGTTQHSGLTVASDGSNWHVIGL